MTYAAPNLALILDRTVAGKNVLGSLRYTGTGETQDVEIQFSAILKLDVLAADALKNQLGRGQQFGGVFTNWTLSAEPISYEGVKTSSVTIAGNTIDVKLQLDGRTGTLALWQLTSNSGIPLRLNYVYNNDASQRGQLPPIRLSFTRRARSSVVSSKDGIRNSTRVPISISYVRLSNGTLQRLRPEVTIMPEELRVIEELGESEVEIPADAVAFTVGDPYSLNEFHNVQSAVLTERVSIRNSIPVTRPDRPGNLRFLKLSVVYLTNGGSEQPQEIKMAPAEILGSTATLTFVRLNQSSRKIRISGTAFYDNGEDRIPATHFETTDIVIDKDTLAP
jgi:hypothetical protein